MNQLISPTEAAAKIFAHTSPLDPATVPLVHALGRVLREPLQADRPFPPFDRVTMDGITFRSQDSSDRTKKLQGLHPAGASTPAPLLQNACYQIMTGAVLPPDCDTVVPYEEVILTATEATIDPAFEITPGQFIHREGSDALKDDLLCAEFTKLNPAHLGLAASIGASELKVTRSPRIQIFTTGDELVPIEKAPEPHQLRRSNGLSLKMALKSWGETDTQLTHLPDNLEATREALYSALSTEKNDLIILSGGISKGKKDFVRPALEALIGEPTFHGVAQRPGKPLAFWSPSESHPPVLALPGNPNSTLTTCYRYLIPLLNRMTGLEAESFLSLPLEKPAPIHPHLTQLLLAILTPAGKLRLLLPQNSGDFLTPLPATHLVEIPPGENHGLAIRIAISSFA